MSREEFVAQSSKYWLASLRGVFSTLPRSAVFDGAAYISDVLSHFMGSNRNHTHLPTSGGFDFESVHANHDGYIELGLSGNNFSIFNPKSLHVEILEMSVINSFLLLDLGRIEPIGLDEDIEKFGSEELVELAPGRFVKRHVWDDGIIGYNENDEAIPLPVQARLVTRWFGGKLLFVAKGSLWNGSPKLYNGQHSSLTADRIREIIETYLKGSD